VKLSVAAIGKFHTILRDASTDFEQIALGVSRNIMERRR
jgi:hypothetical protein